MTKKQKRLRNRVLVSAALFFVLIVLDKTGKLDVLSAAGGQAEPVGTTSRSMFFRVRISLHAASSPEIVVTSPSGASACWNTAGSLGQPNAPFPVPAPKPRSSTPMRGDTGTTGVSPFGIGTADAHAIHAPATTIRIFFMFVSESFH